MHLKHSSKVILILFFVHFTGDFYQSFFSPLFPVIQKEFDLTLTQIGFLTSIITIASFLTQPLSGIVADKTSPKLLMLAGLFLSTIFIPLVGIATWYWLLMIFVGLGALGSSMYHPSASGLMILHTETRKAFGMSIFGLGGTLAFSVGPIFVTSMVALLGLRYLPLMSIMGIIAIILVIIFLPSASEKKGDIQSFSKIPRKNLNTYWKIIFVIWLVATLRSLTDFGIKTYFPILFSNMGNTLVSVGMILSLYVFGGALSALLCGRIADKYGYKLVFYSSFVLAVPSLLLLLFSDGSWIYVASFLSGFTLLATMFPSVALAASLVPENKSLVSSLTLGFAVGCGGVMAPLIGQLAEAYGLLEVMVSLAFMPLICLVLTPLIPEKGL